MFLHFITWIKALQKSPDTKAFSSTYFSKLWQAVIPSQHGASVGVQSSCGALKRLAWKSKSEMFSYVSLINSHTQHDVFVGVQSSSGALKHLALKCKSEMFSCVLPTSLRIRCDASVETNPPAVLFSIHSLILDRVWYHAPWLLGYMRRR